MANVFYVYYHREPGTNEVVYVGKGTGGRAWDVTRCRGKHPEHQAWMQNLMIRGFIPTEWVCVVSQGLSEEDAFEGEKKLLHTRGRPRFNRQSGELNNKAKLTDEQARNIYTRAISGESPAKLAVEFNVSRTAIQHIKARTQWRATTACLVN